MTDTTILYFGSFNPIHRGHIAIAEYLLRQEFGRELWFVVSPHNPLKSASELAPEADRLKMVELAIEASPLRDRIKASGIEFDLPKPSYTIDTLRQLKKLFPQRRFTLLMGADNIASIDRWKQYRELLAEYDILVYPRGIHTLPEGLDGRITVLKDAPLLEFDASSIRVAVEKRESIEKMVDPKVIEYIKNKKLYE